ncbi:hypothetical protein PHYSODRAFT_297713 [Phytophthora sojae]|uniref:SWIM-type domain-containing protein n=1 Tax=Phytophthora sojae (strain P6497) TaxID=1094619 RepID=G4YT51_PHYSP|nr:hypothetical protein PHYSODRAFT_297713 [Phytophthora sojae]EGZ26445.1 hypothetical protein PHYSODRAFT_297713 [Phytophthora sojae]|eukprot:XP_009521733.1 hypothetical protein PHYSODRAFT_297713 [Phytophthora sojae]
MTKELHKRHLNSETWVAKGMKVTPAADKIYSSQLAEMGNYNVTMTIKGKQASVYRVGQSPPLRRTVDLEGNRCTCAFMDQHQIPCKHMIAVLSQADSTRQCSRVLVRATWSPATPKRSERHP